MEVKAVKVSQPTRARAVASDLAALLAIDWPATLQFPGPDRGVDDRWWQDRHQITNLWAVSIAFIHGLSPMDNPTRWVPAQFRAQLAILRQRFPERPPWLIQTEKGLAQHLFESAWSGAQQTAVMLAWAAPV